MMLLINHVKRCGEAAGPAMMNAVMRAEKDKKRDYCLAAGITFDTSVFGECEAGFDSGELNWRCMKMMDKKIIERGLDCANRQTELIKIDSN